MDLERLLHGEKVTDLEKTILEYLSQNRKHLEKISIQQVAKATYSSNSTVFRLAQKLGFSGYSEMVYKLKEGADHQAFSLSVSETATQFATLIHQVFQQNQHNLEECRDFLSEKRPRFFILGTGYSGIIAEYLYKKLLGKGNDVIFSNGGDTNALFLNNLDRIGGLICISKSGETEIIYEKAKKAKERNIPVISFTQNDQNSLANWSSINFVINDQNQYDWNNMKTSQFYPMLLLYLEYFVEKVFR